jgi:hypothetical protein
MAISANTNKASLRDEVAHLVLQHPEWSRARVYGALCNKFGEQTVLNLIKERAVGNWIRDLKEQPDSKPWQPWSLDFSTEVRPGFLLTLQVISQVILQRGLFEREVLWAAKLELDLHGLDPIAQFFVISEYAGRDAVAQMSSQPITTGDLDTLLVLKPWTEAGKKRYEEAFQLGALVPPTIRLMVVPVSNPRADHMYFSLRGCIKMGVPFQAMYESIAGEVPETVDFKDPPSEREDFLLNADWHEVLMDYWKSVIRAEQKSEEEQDDK